MPMHRAGQIGTDVLLITYVPSTAASGQGDSAGEHSRGETGEVPTSDDDGARGYRATVL